VVATFPWSPTRGHRGGRHQDVRPRLRPVV